MVAILSHSGSIPNPLPDYAIWEGNPLALLSAMQPRPIFDIIITSPPIPSRWDHSGQIWDALIAYIIPGLKDTGSLCWHVGDVVAIGPLDYEFAPIFKKYGLKLRNRIVLTLDHGTDAMRRFSPRYEVILWYTRSDDYVFNLDSVRIPSKYPGKKQYHGPRKGQLSGNPRGKNPEDVWEAYTGCNQGQMPDPIIERLILALTAPGGLVFDPFARTSAVGAIAAAHGRRFLGCESERNCAIIGSSKIKAILGEK